MSSIRHVITTSATAEQAYAALTSHAGVTAWWAKDADIGQGVGSTHVLRFAKGDGTVTMNFEVEALTPGANVLWRCTANANPVWVGTTLRWQLRPSPSGCEIAFEHAGFVEHASPPYQMTVDGWEHFAASLKRYLDEGEGQPW